MTDTVYAELWRDLVERSRKEPAQTEERMMARWAKRARASSYTEEKRRRDRDDLLMRFVLDRLEDEDTVLDVGAGIGRWSIPMARRCRKVTALDKMDGMLDILRENASHQKVQNIDTVQGDWHEIDLEIHDYVLSSHAAYASPDILGYARKMQALANKACYMVMRVPRYDGVLGELSRRIHGCWHDSPNFLIAYNALLRAGIGGHVIMEETGRLWHDDTLEDALDRAKRHLQLHSQEHDRAIIDVLEQRLSFRGGEYWWPDWMRSALIWWRPQNPCLPTLTEMRKHTGTPSGQPDRAIQSNADGGKSRGDRR